MKFVWEEKDIEPGVIVSKPFSGENWLIGYRSDLHGGARYVQISLKDGLVTKAYTQTDMAAMLNDNGIEPQIAFQRVGNLEAR